MNDLAASLLSISKRLWPFLLVLALCGTSFFIGEQYPLTNFPMYKSFPDHTFYVYVGDKNGEPIPVKDLTGINTSKLKKPYNKEIDRVRKKLKKRKLELSPAERQEAGVTALRTLYNNAPAAGRERLDELAPLQLFHVWIHSRDGKSVEDEPEKVASFSPNP